MRHEPSMLRRNGVGATGPVRSGGHPWRRLAVVSQAASLRRPEPSNAPELPTPCRPPVGDTAGWQPALPLQFVFGGGPQTVQTTLGFQNAPNAFSCIVKGSGRFCHAIERCLELEKELDQKINKERVGWLLQASMSKPNLSNHEFSQIKSITDNKEKYTSPPLLARRAPPLTLIHSLQFHFQFYFPIIFSNSIFQFYFPIIFFTRAQIPHF